MHAGGCRRGGGHLAATLAGVRRRDERHAVNVLQQQLQVAGQQERFGAKLLHAHGVEYLQTGQQRRRLKNRRVAELEAARSNFSFERLCHVESNRKSVVFNACHRVYDAPCFLIVAPPSRQTRKSCGGVFMGPLCKSRDVQGANLQQQGARVRIFQQGHRGPSSNTCARRVISGEGCGA